MAQINYNDLVKNESQIAWYSTSGWKAKRLYCLDKCDMTDPSGTIFKVYDGASPSPSPATELPQRGAPHPYKVIVNDWSTYNFEHGVTDTNNAFCADQITIKAETSTQIWYEVEYSVLTAATQEPSELGDTAPALLSYASGVQNTTISVDLNGQKLVVPYINNNGTSIYGTLQGNYDICPNGGRQAGNLQGAAIMPFVPSTYSPYVPGSPSTTATATRQNPATLIIFTRRETKQRNPDGLVGFMNEKDWIIGDEDYFPRSVLCTRVDSKTYDNGVSYVVVYEFQVGQVISTPPGAKFVPPAAEIEPGVTSPFDVASYYILKSGVGLGPNTSPTTKVITPAVQPGQIPPDASPSVFQIYDTYDFEGNLFLT